MRTLYIAGLTFAALSLLLVMRGSLPEVAYSHPPGVTVTPQGEAGAWFQGMKPYCNSVEVETRHRWNPPPGGFQGTALSAACYALAGKIETARDKILTLEGDDRWRAAGVVFNVGHPVADAGDDRSAGPIMELVVEFWPNHYMALYHAGMARLGLGDRDLAADYLERFLEHYEIQDGWTRTAISALEDLGRR